MKTKKVILTALAAATLAIGCGAFAACDNHTHTYSKDWEKDATGHWHQATCDDLKKGDKDFTKDFAEHSYGDDNICDICNYEKEEEGSHTHAYTKWGSSETEHWKYCEADNEIDETTRDEHDFTNGNCECGKEKPVAVTIVLNKTELTLGLGNLEAELTATVSNGADVEWESSNEAVVLVGETGSVEALKPGTATITATIKDTEISATCEVTVEKAYYVIGGMDSAWNKVGVFGQDGVIYFMPTETEGIFETESFELKAQADFQVAPVGDTSGDWWKEAFNGNYIAENDEVLSKNNGGNIAVEKHGKYTITLDLTGDTAVISGVCDEEIDDGDVEVIYYLRGAMNSWNEATTEEAAGEYAFTNNDDGTYTLIAELVKGQEFKVAIVNNAWIGAFGESAVPRALIGNNGTATKETAYKLTWTSSDNIGVGLSGKYTFTLTPDGGENNQLSYTFEATAATEEEPEPAEVVVRYFIKGTAVKDGGWGAAAVDKHELKAKDGEEGVYELEIELDDGEFMFYAKKVNADGSLGADDNSKEIKNGKLDDASKELVTSTGNGNISIDQPGKYKFTYSTATDKLTIELLEAGQKVEKTYQYYIKGSMDGSSWASPVNSTRELTPVEGEEGVYSITIHLNANIEFGFYSCETGSTTQKEWFGNLTLADGVTAVTKPGNFKTVAAGTYTFIFNLDDKTLGVEFVADSGTEIPDPPAEPVDIHCYIKGPAVASLNGAWDPADAEERALTELTKEDGEGYVFTATIHLVAGDFMFYTFAEYEDGVEETQYDYFNNSNSTFTSGKYTTEDGEEAECVTATTNYTAAVEGYYTITVTRTGTNAATITFSYSATNSSETEAPEAE